eukprot:jgi/Mesvir1/27228/Mv07072-RA.1
MRLEPVDYLWCYSSVYTMDIDAFIDTLPVYELGEGTFNQALEVLVTPPREEVGEGWTQCVAYEPSTEYAVNNIAVLEVDGQTGDLIVKLDRLPACDAIRDITSDVRVKVVVGEDEFDPKALTVVPFLSMYTYTGLKFYLDGRNPPKHFSVKYRCLLLDEKNRKLARAAPLVTTRTHVYRDGTASRR